MSSSLELPPSPTDLFTDSSIQEPSPGSLTPAASICSTDTASISNEKDRETKSKESPDTASRPKALSHIHSYQRGVWTMHEHVPTWTESVPGMSIIRDLAGFFACIPYIRALLIDLWELGPFLCVVYIATRMLRSIMPTLLLARSSAFLHMIEKAVFTKQVDRRAFAIAVGLQFTLAIVSWARKQAASWCAPTLRHRFKHLVKERVMAAQLRMDLPTSENPEVKAKFSSCGKLHRGGGKAWEAFTKLVDFGSLVLELVSTSSFILGTMLHQPGGRTIVALCLVSPILNSFQERRDWNKVFYAVANNTPYLRMETLYSFTNDAGMKEEMLGNGMGEYVIREYKEARKELGDTSDDHPWSSEQPPWSLFSLGQDIARDSALVLLGIRMVLAPETIPLMSIAVLEQTSMTLDNTMQRLVDGGNPILEAFHGVKALYEIDRIPNEIKDGDLTYPVGGSTQKGMEVEFRNVTFKYPRTDALVIDGLSFKIAAGSLCVVVGENGCGKSSTLKLLNRVYDVDSGEILIDGKSIKNYRIGDLRAASAFMHQDYQHFDFSLRENIGFGNAAKMDDLDAIKEAARLGGAEEFIEKLPASYDTKMESTTGWDHTIVSGDVPADSALDILIKAKKDSPKAFSGGQTQRLALSRTFMRSTTGDVKLLAYDEPSAALDPKAEFELQAFTRPSDTFISPLTSCRPGQL